MSKNKWNSPTFNVSFNKEISDYVFQINPNNYRKDQIFDLLPKEFIQTEGLEFIFLGEEIRGKELLRSLGFIEKHVV